MRLLVSCLSALMLLAACGQRNAFPDEDSTPTPPSPLATGLEAIDIAREAVPTATGVARLAVSFPRPGGTAEYWSVWLFDPESPSSYQQVEIQGRETVDLHVADPPTGAGAPVGFEVLRFDSSSAAQAVEGLDWAVGPEVEVTLNPVAFDVGGDDAPSSLRGRGVWHFVVTRRSASGPQLLGTVWISAESGEVLEAQRT